MGGSGGGGGSSHPLVTNITSCIDLRFTVNLSSPNSEVLIRLRATILLDIELNSAGTGCVVIFEGEVAGSIIHSNLQQLVSCIKSGENFYAQVRSVEGGRCSVLIVHESAV